MAVMLDMTNIIDGFLFFPHTFLFFTLDNQRVVLSIAVCFLRHVSCECLHVCLAELSKGEDDEENRYVGIGFSDDAYIN